MKKIIFPVSAGGAPLNNDRFGDVLGTDIWDSVENILRTIQDAWSGGSANGPYGIILQGCDITGAGTPYGMNAGVVYLNGKIIRFPGFVASGGILDATTAYSIRNGSTAITQKTFADGVLRNFITEDIGAVGGGTPGTGHYIGTFLPNAGAAGLAPFKLPQAILNGGVQTAINAGVASSNATTAALQPTYSKQDFTTAGAGAVETALTIPRTASKTTRYLYELVSRRVSGADAAGSGSSQSKVRAVTDVAGTGTLGTETVIDSWVGTANAAVVTLAVSGGNTLVQVQSLSGHVYSCRLLVKVMEIV